LQQQTIDILDPAIKRAGRFDRQITINNPNLKERIAILKVHARGKRLDESVALPQIAQRTIGFSGADLANLLNEAAILATRRKRLLLQWKKLI
jgi:cell division protease FtsH